MIGILVAAHGGLAESLVKTVRIFTGNVPQLKAVDLLPESGPDSFVDDLREQAEQIDDGDGVLIIADLFGGTPSNSAWKLISEREGIAAVAGMNLTMLLEAVLNRENANNPKELADVACRAAREGVQKLPDIS
jgi:mannose/fructose/sorbose-specific phosphotransferase system IIA component